MRFVPAGLEGAFLVELESLPDDRGFFARSWDVDEFGEYGLDPSLVQCNISFNKRRGTVRGLHHQAPPYEEAKLVRCTRGAIFDVIVDLRPASPTRLAWRSFKLDADTRAALYIPRGFAHGFQSLLDDTEVFYQMSEKFHPDAARGLRWDDPVLAIPWPVSQVIASERDGSYSLISAESS